MAFVETLILIHAALGGLALLSGSVAMIVRKGNPAHRLSGKVFAYAMLASIGLSLLVACLPGHENPFLFAIGIFSGYFILSGYRALHYRRAAPDLRLDQWLAWVLLLTSLGMIGYPLVAFGELQVVLTIFGLTGLFFGLRDLRTFRNSDKLRKNWLLFHLGKMSGGYIAAFTAFLVVNEFLPGLANWLAPGILGTVFIAWWSRKVRAGSGPAKKVLERVSSRTDASKS